MQMTAAKLTRWAGLSAMAAGIIFAGIQPIHPADVLASVTTPAWAIVTALKTAMGLLFLLGITGIYEAFILPLLATAAPQFVDGVLGTLAAGRASDVNLGALPTIYSLGVGGAYMLGGLLFGIATFRADILPRWPAGLLTVAVALPPWLRCSRTRSMRSYLKVLPRSRMTLPVSPQIAFDIENIPFIIQYGVPVRASHFALFRCLVKKTPLHTRSSSTIARLLRGIYNARIRSRA